ncbi:Alpha/Beta hydrolase protein [Nemania sp. FL0031]|nr:Alpha/Beta hydrolase protein [Nemania sp. FL0031]
MEPSLTAIEKVDLALRWSLIFFPRVIFNCLRCAFLACPTPIDTYKSWIETKRAAAAENGDLLALSRLSTQAEELPDGKSSLLWIGNRKQASRYVLFFPGGGYIAPLVPGHLEWCYRAYVGTTGGREVAVAVLQYTLCPDARHPTQLHQATAALSHLLSSGIPASHIVVGGDSAGGNLTAQLLGRLARADSQILLPEPLAGVFLVSPWLSGTTNTRSFVENEQIDMLSAGHSRASLREFMGPIKTRDDFSTGSALPLDSDGKWMEGWAKVTRALYITVGANEVLRDQGVHFAEAVRYRNDTIKVRLEMCEMDAHDFTTYSNES